MVLNNYKLNSDLVMVEKDPEKSLSTGMDIDRQAFEVKVGSGKVVKVGHRTKNDESVDIAVGDTVIFSTYDRKIEIENKRYLILYVNDILLVKYE